MYSEFDFQKFPYYQSVEEWTIYLRITFYQATSWDDVLYLLQTFQLHIKSWKQPGVSFAIWARNFKKLLKITEVVAETKLQSVITKLQVAAYHSM